MNIDVYDLCDEDDTSIPMLWAEKSNKSEVTIPEGIITKSYDDVKRQFEVEMGATKIANPPCLLALLLPLWLACVLTFLLAVLRTQLLTLLRTLEYTYTLLPDQL